ncbi:hypothetical protein BH10PSE18_BH10PSE18_46930 [soil metagenome]
MKIPVPFLALLCLSVTIGAEANLATSHARLQARSLLRVSMSPGAAPADAVARQEAATQPWWRGFQDDTLDALIAAAQQHASRSGSTSRPTANVRLMGDTLQLPIDMQVAAAYVTARVDQLSLMLIDQAQGAFSQEDALLARQVRMPTLQAAGRRSLQLRMDAAAVAARSHTARRNDALALLATLSGLQPPDLMARIGPALRNEKLPRFVAPVPHALPAAVLLQRDDVALAGALYHLDPRPFLDGWIEPEDAAAGMDDGSAQASANDDAATIAVVGDPLSQVIARAHREVAQATAEVVRRNQVAAALYDRAAASRQSVAQLQAQADAAARTDANAELELLEDYEQLMLHSQQLTSASADLALTWIKLLYRLGGSGTLAAPLQRDTPPDAATGVLPPPMHGQAGRSRSPLV